MIIAALLSLFFEFTLHSELRGGGKEAYISMQKREETKAEKGGNERAKKQEL